MRTGGEKPIERENEREMEMGKGNSLSLKYIFDVKKWIWIELNGL